MIADPDHEPRSFYVDEASQSLRTMMARASCTFTPPLALFGATRRDVDRERGNQQHCGLSGGGIYHGVRACWPPPACRCSSPAIPRWSMAAPRSAPAPGRAG